MVIFPVQKCRTKRCKTLPQRPYEMVLCSTHTRVIVQRCYGATGNGDPPYAPGDMTALYEVLLTECTRRYELGSVGHRLSPQLDKNRIEFQKG